MYRLKITKRAEKQLLKLPAKEQKRITDAFDKLRNNPHTGKMLQGPHEDFWTFRVWPYRIIYAIEKHIVTVTVVAVGHRKDVYRLLR